jgi:hypothetical protein
LSDVVIYLAKIAQGWGVGQSKRIGMVGNKCRIWDHALPQPMRGEARLGNDQVTAANGYSTRSSRRSLIVGPRAKSSMSAETRQVGVYKLIKHNMLICSNVVFDVLYRLQVS